MTTASDASGAIFVSSAQSVATWVKCAGERALAAPPPLHPTAPTDDGTVVELVGSSHSSGVKNATISSHMSNAGRAA
ncbi:MAG: hypothetical protein NZM04_09290 [Methylacidiphilales bacterium]|nr:hypothetical protein [Candidatus Methylacidiphilales bacterium]